MSAPRFGKPRIAIVGAGNLAGALAPSLQAAGYAIDEIVSRGPGPSLQRARALAREVAAAAVVVSRARLRAEIVWFCIPDGEIAKAVKSLTDAVDWNNKIAFHSSGALTSDVLAVLRNRGASVASLHPLMTFVPGSRPALVGAPFAIEGDTKAARTARALVLNLHGQAFPIRKEQKVAYHAWGMFASPLLTALLAATERVAAAAGVSQSAARKRMFPILNQTLVNYANLGAPGSFSGPIRRGDIDTVKKHLNVLRGVPGARDVYVALARVALRDLPANNRTALEKIINR